MTRTADNLADLAKQSISKRQSEFGASVRCFVTDKASNMTKMCELPKKADAKLLLLQLHWLPLRQRIQYKVAVLTRKVRTTGAPSYLS